VASTYLTAKDIMADLQVSRSTAYTIMREMDPIQVGRSLRVSRANYAAWQASKREEWQARNPARTVTSKQRSHRPGKSSDNASALIPPIVPRTRPKPTD